MPIARPSRTRSLLALALLGPLSGAAATIDLELAGVWQHGVNASAEHLVVTTDGQLFVSGDFLDNIDRQPSRGGSDLFVSAFSPTGEKRWTRTLGSDDNDSIGASVTDDRGNLYVTGTTPGNMGGEPAGSFDVFLSKLDRNGSILWTRQFGSAQYDAGLALTIDADGNVYLAGKTAGRLGTDPTHGGQDMFLASFDANGERRWTRQFGTAETDIATALTAIGDTIYLAGNSRGDGHGGAIKPDIVLRAFSRDGEPLWEKRLGTPRPDYAVGLERTTDGDLLMLAYSYGDLGELPNRGDADLYLARFSAQGERKWIRQLGSDRSDIPKAMSTDRDGRILVTGYTYGALDGSEPRGKYDAFVAAWSADGEPLGHTQFGGRGFNQTNAIASHPNGTVFVAGNTATDLDDDPETGDGRVFLAALGQQPASMAGPIDRYPPSVILQRDAEGFSGIAGDSEDIDLDGIVTAREDMNANGIVDFRNEDLDDDGQLDGGEDLDGDGRINRDTGLVSIALSEDSDNLVLDRTPFEAGALTARFTLRRKDPSRPASGRLIVSDGGGNRVVREIQLDDRFCATARDQVVMENDGAIHVPKWAISARDMDSDWPTDTLWISRTDNPGLFEIPPHVSYPSWGLRYTLKPNVRGSVTVWYDVVDFDSGGQQYHCGEESFRLTVVPETPTPEQKTAESAPERIQVVTGLTTEIDLLAHAGTPGLVTAVSQPTHGNVTWNEGIARYVSEPGYTGNDAFSYWIKTESGDETAHRVLLAIVPDGDSGDRLIVSVKGDDGSRRFTAYGGTGSMNWSLLLGGLLWGWRRQANRRP